jgi:hypothetical protein
MTVQPYWENTPATNVPAVPEFERWTTIYEPMIGLAERLAYTPFVPETIRQRPNGQLRDRAEVVADTFAVLLCGHGLGIGPIQALQSIAMIKGKPFVLTEVVLGLAMRAGHQVQWLESTDKRATVRVTRGDGHGSAEVTYTLSQAQAAGLTTKDNWRRMPAEMLRARAVRAALKMVAPDLALGLETAENGPQGPETQPTGTTVVQVAPATPTEPMQPLDPVQPSPVNIEPPPAIEAPPELVDDGLVTPAQLRKLNALLGELDRAEGRRLTRDERRELIGSLAGVEGLESAKDLTRTQASTAIDQVAGMVAKILDAEQQQGSEAGEVPGE